MEHVFVVDDRMLAIASAAENGEPMTFVTPNGKFRYVPSSASANSLGELARFADMLTARGIDHIAEISGRVVSPEWRLGEGGGWSVICIPYSYGYEEGLLEFWDGKGDPIGWLKAEDALALVEEAEAK